MKDHSVAARYAKVLFDLDCKQGDLDKRLDDFKLIAEIFKLQPKLIRLLKTSQVSLNDKRKLLSDIFGKTFDSRFIHFISYLIEKKRLSYLNHIGIEYEFLVNKHLDRWEANVITAVPMDAKSESKLVEKLETVFHKKAHLSKKIDPKIIGGAILILANGMLDWSVRGRLKKLKDNLIATQV